MAVSEDVREKVQHLRTDGPQQTVSLMPVGDYSLRLTLMRAAWQDAGVSRDDPPDVTQTYLPDENVVVIKLPDNE